MNLTKSKLYLVVLPSVATIVLVTQIRPLAATYNSSCTLNCEHGGYCAMIPGDEKQLAHQVQSGELIQECVCMADYGGLGCEQTTEKCSLSTRKCPSGADCTLSTATGEWTCDCAIADRVSSFAGNMCRKRYTEYCSGAYAPDRALIYCTNGGKCKSDFITAKVAPGNASANLEFQYLGCVCNEAFYGPHCEFLKYDETHVTTTKAPVVATHVTTAGDATAAGDATEAGENSTLGAGSTASSSTTSSSSSLSQTSAIALLILIAAGLMAVLSGVLGLLVYRRYRHMKRGNAIGSTNISQTGFVDSKLPDFNTRRYMDDDHHDEYFFVAAAHEPPVDPEKSLEPFL
jgi:hypothetical protein